MTPIPPEVTAAWALFATVVFAVVLALYYCGRCVLVTAENHALRELLAGTQRPALYGSPEVDPRD